LDGLEHRRRTAGEHSYVLVALLEQLVNEVGDVAVVAGGAVVGRDLSVREEARCLSMLGGAKPDERATAPALLEHRERRDSYAATDQDRVAASVGRREALAERTDEEDLLANPKPAEALRPRPNVLQQEPDLALAGI
jgi:hypothetical protein